MVIERQRAHFDPEAPIVAPVIRIERQSSQTGSGNKAGNAASVNFQNGSVLFPHFNNSPNMHNLVVNLT